MAEVLLTSEGIIRLNDRFLGPTLRKIVPENARELAEGFGFTVKVRGDDIYLVSGDYVAKISNRVEFYRVLTLSFVDYFGGVCGNILRKTLNLFLIGLRSLPAC